MLLITFADIKNKNKRMNKIESQAVDKLDRVFNSRIDVGHVFVSIGTSNTAKQPNLNL
jgi:CRISPR/Cas system-associated endoribonuclease Cas2